MRHALLGLALLSSAPAALGCSTLDLHVSPGLGLPPTFTTTPGVAFPHLRTLAAPSELWRAGDSTGADWPAVTLYAVRGPGPGQATLHAAGGCNEPPLWADTAVYLRELHVATTGSPTGDGSPANPFDTLTRAASVARPGDNIIIHAGNYPGSSYLTGPQGTSASPIRIGGASGEPAPVLGSTAVSEALHLTDPAFVLLEDLVVDGPTGNGINIDDGGDYTTPAHDVIARRIEVRNIGTGGNQDCLKLSGLDDFHVVASRFRSCGAGGSGIDMVGCHRGRIEGNDFRSTGSNAVQAKGGSSEVVIRGNLMVDAGDRAMNLGGSTGLAFFRPTNATWEARDIQALSNVVVRSQAPTAFVGCDGCLVANNTFYLPTRWVTRILQETTDPRFVQCRNGRFINNIIVFDQASISTFVNVGPNTQPSTFTFAHNLWFARDNPGFTGPSLPVAESNPILQRDPLLANPGGEDFHLAATSPAIGAGMCLAEVTLDRDRVCYATPPAVGAHEGP